MPTNPIKAALDWLHGEDIWDTSQPERKQMFLGGTNSALLETMLVHGPGATEISRGVYNQDANSAVFACLLAISVAYPEAPLRVYQAAREPGRRDMLPDSPFQKLLDEPNPWMGAEELWFWIQWAKHCDGNAYVRKVRSGNPETGNVIELWPISPRLVEPKTIKGSGDFVSFYRYHYDAGHYEDISPNNMIHFRLGINDADMRLGLSPLKRLVMEVSSDGEATQFTDALLGNYGVPGLVVTTPQDVQMDATKAMALKESVSSAFGSKNRGNVSIITNGGKIEQFGFDPRSMDLEAIHRLPEERISAVLRVPAIIAGLGAGLSRATYANFREARAMFTEQCILPLYRFDQRVINQRLRPDFTSDPKVYAAFDLTDVRALQEDEDSKYNRLNEAVKTGWVTPDEARADVGLPPLGDQLQPAPPVVGSKALEFKAGDFTNHPDLMAALVELAQPSLEADLEDFFDAQRKRVKRKIMGA